MMTPQPLISRQTAVTLDFVALDSLPCGCVAVAYQARPWELAMVTIEAKGPHCLRTAHAQGRVLELGRVRDLLGEGEGEE